VLLGIPRLPDCSLTSVKPSDRARDAIRRPLYARPYPVNHYLCHLTSLSHRTLLSFLPRTTQGGVMSVPGIALSRGVPRPTEVVEDTSRDVAWTSLGELNLVYGAKLDANRALLDSDMLQCLPHCARHRI